MGCHQKSPTDYYEDINYDDFPNGSDIMGVHMASKSSKKVTFEFVLKLLSFLSDIYWQKWEAEGRGMFLFW